MQQKKPTPARDSNQFAELWSIASILIKRLLLEIVKHCSDLYCRVCYHVMVNVTYNMD